MIIAITSTGKDQNSPLDRRFGRAKYILFYDTGKSSYRFENNDVNLNAPQGAGIQTAQNVVKQQATVVISGNIGPKAFKVLSAADIEMFISPDQSISNAVQAYLNDKLSKLSDPNVQGHWS